MLSSETPSRHFFEELAKTLAESDPQDPETRARAVTEVVISEELRQRMHNANDSNSPNDD
jgi:hypothetical protein